MKNISIKFFIFLFIFSIIFYLLPNIIDKHRDAKNWDYIYNTSYEIDVLFMGSSLIFTSLDPHVIDPMINKNTFNLGSSGQFIIQTYYNLIEVLKYRKIKLVVLDVNSIITNREDQKIGFIYNNLSGMKFSRNKINSFLNSIDNNNNSGVLEISKMSYYKQFEYIVSLIVKEKFNWKNRIKSIQEIISNNNEIQHTKGFLGRESIIKLNDFYDIDNSNIEYKKISKENLDYLEDFINLCQKYDIDIILLETPTLINRKIDNQLDYYIEKYNIKYYDFNNNYSLNFKREDFSDKLHLSRNGARKFSLIFADILNNF